jgi:hypothetical protein
MTTPNAPYCKTDDVAALVPQLIHAASDFTASTAIPAIRVTKFIGWVSSQIDLAFAAVGFFVPYQVISGEAWPIAQTHALELMTSFGVAGLLVGPVIKPAPAMGNQSGKSENAFTASYTEFLRSIPENGAGFRMNYHPGSKAEQMCRYPRGPVTDHLLGYLDPTDYQTVTEYTAVIETVRQIYGVGNVFPLDHLKSVRDTLLA